MRQEASISAGDRQALSPALSSNGEGIPLLSRLLTRILTNLDVVALYADLECIDGQARVVDPFAVSNAKPPGMPGANNDAVDVEIASTERRSHVGTQIVDCMIFSVVEENGDEPVANLKRPPFSLGNRALPGHGDVFGADWSGFSHAMQRQLVVESGASRMRRDADSAETYGSVRASWPGLL